MRILITGNLGYVGAPLVRLLRRTYPHACLIGYDSALFAQPGVRTPPDRLLDTQIIGDIRDMAAAVFEGVEAVVHLAAVSNDPMGSRFAAVTAAVNERATAEIGAKARSAGVKQLVFASTCSVYGFAGNAATESSAVAPQTAYARAKAAAEQHLAAIAGPTTTVTCLRFGTACGMSDRLRLDLVLNDFVAGALGCGEIELLSDGTAWRPLIDVHDMARAIIWGISRNPADGGRFLVVNVGANSGNLRILDLAHAVAEEIPQATVRIGDAAPADARSYQVDFSLFAALAGAYQPQVPLRESIAMLVQGLRGMGFADRQFRESHFIRLKHLEQQIAAGQLTPDLRRAAAAPVGA